MKEDLRIPCPTCGMDFTEIGFTTRESLQIEGSYDYFDGVFECYNVKNDWDSSRILNYFCPNCNTELPDDVIIELHKHME